jgi:hypothetical protein
MVGIVDGLTTNVADGTFAVGSFAEQPAKTKHKHRRNIKASCFRTNIILPLSIVLDLGL